MSGPQTAAVLLKVRYFKRYQKQILRLLSQRRPSSPGSSDAGEIGGYSVDDLLAPARADLAAHIANKANPHVESMDTYNAYSAATIATKLAAKIPNAVVPISSYGVIDNLNDAGVMAAWSYAGFKLSVNKTFNVVLSGTPYTLPPATIDLTTLSTNPANQTFNVYVRLQFGVISYQVSLTSPPESVSVMFIGTVTCGASGITSINFGTVTRIETFRLSTLPVGSAIPVTLGTYDAVTPLPATWNPA